MHTIDPHLPDCTCTGNDQIDTDTRWHAMPGIMLDHPEVINGGRPVYLPAIAAYWTAQPELQYRASWGGWVADRVDLDRAAADRADPVDALVLDPERSDLGREHQRQEVHLAVAAAAVAGDPTTDRSVPVVATVLRAIARRSGASAQGPDPPRQLAKRAG